MSKITWKSETRRLGDLIDWERNPRQSTEKQVEYIQDSLRRFGQVHALAISPNNEIYDGHQRKSAAELMDDYGPDAIIDVRVASRELSLEERKQLIIYLHEGAIGEWDFDGLANLYDIDELKDWGFPANQLGMIVFPEDEEEGEKDPGPQVEKAEELVKDYGVAVGQIWACGPHRIICGDCTDYSTIGRLLDGETIDLCVTSPPYSDLRTYEIGEFDWDELMNGFSDVIFSFLSVKASVVVNLGQKHSDNKVDFYWNNWLEHCEEIGFPLFGLYIWAKNTGLPGNWNGRLMPSHEFIFHFKQGQIQANKWIVASTPGNKNALHRFRQQDGSLKDPYSLDKFGQSHRIPYSVFNAAVQHTTPAADNEHPARYSVDFVSQLIKTWSNEGEVVIDPFLGSGTTLIACEELNRRCFGADIEPKYVAMTLERYRLMTENDPILL